MSAPVATQVDFRSPTVADGGAIWHLTRDSGALDLNSPYSYLILCEHFARTCVVAEAGGELRGFLTGYLIPDRPDTLFVWQVAVHARARRMGLARRMLDHLLERLGPDGVRFVEATVTPDNIASRSLFRAFARDSGTEITETPLFTEELFPRLEPESESTPHDPELLLRLGPLDRTSALDLDE